MQIINCSRTKGTSTHGTRVQLFRGPAVLPEEVLKQAASEMLDYEGTGMSVMEMSHRSAAFTKIITEAEQDLARFDGHSG